MQLTDCAGFVSGKKKLAEMATVESETIKACGVCVIEFDGRKLATVANQSHESVSVADVRPIAPQLIRTVEFVVIRLH